MKNLGLVGLILLGVLISVIVDRGVAQQSSASNYVLATEIAALKVQVASQERRIATLEQRLANVAARTNTTPAPAKTNPAPAKTPPAPAKPPAAPPKWHNPANWERIEWSMSRQQVEIILGTPTKRERDEYGEISAFVYEGNVPGSGYVVGRVEFVGEKVRSVGVLKPDF